MKFSELFKYGLLIALIGLALSCQSPEQTDAELFEQAEASYRAGRYVLAIERYESFLSTYPESPLSETARLRLRTIHREVKSVLKRENLPQPIHHDGADSTSDVPMSQENSSIP